MSTTERTKHNPGPWVVERHQDRSPSVLADSNGIPAIEIANMPTCFLPHHEGYKKVIANARLIAAAPEMLEALRDLVAEADSLGWPEDHPPVVAARAAVARAEG